MPDTPTSRLAGQRALDRFVAQAENAPLAPGERGQIASAIEQHIVQGDLAERQMAESALQRILESRVAQGPVGPSRIVPPPVPDFEMQVPLLPPEAAPPPPVAATAPARPSSAVPAMFRSAEEQALADLYAAPSAPAGAPAPTLDAPPVRGRQGPAPDEGDYVSDRPTGMGTGDPGFEDHQTQASPVYSVATVGGQDFTLLRSDGRAVARVTPEMIDAAGGDPVAAVNSIQGLDEAQRGALLEGIVRTGVAPVAPTRPRTAPGMMQQSIRLEQSGPVGLEQLAAEEANRDELAAAQAELTRASLNQISATADAMDAHARRSVELAAQRQREQSEINTQVRDRLGALDNIMAAARDTRIDPEAFYGGTGGRIAATLAVALGQAGSILTGGENTALQIIQAGIDRSIRAQMANAEVAQRGAGQAMSAFQMFRQVVGDEMVAADLARATELQSYARELQSQLTRLQGPRLLAGQRVLSALQNAQGLAESRARQEANGRIVTEVTERVVARRGDVARAAGTQRQAVARADALFSSVRAGQEAVSAVQNSTDPEVRTAGAQEAIRRASETAALGGWEQAEAMLTGLLQETEPGSEERTLVEGQIRAHRLAEADALGLRVEPGVYSTSPRARRIARSVAAGTGGPSTQRAAAAEAARVRRQMQRREHPLNLSGLPHDPESRADLAESVQRISATRGSQDIPDFSRVFDPSRAGNLTQAQQQELAAAQVSFELLQNLTRDIRRFRTNAHTNILNLREAADLRANYEAFLEAELLRVYGTTATDEQMTRLREERYPDPTAMTAGRFLGIEAIDSVLNTWNGISRSVERSIATQIRSFGHQLLTSREAGRPGGTARLSPEEQAARRRRSSVRVR